VASNALLQADDTPAEHHDAEQWRLVVIATLALVYLFALTKGPLFWLRRDRAPLAGDFIDDVWVQTTFVAISASIIAVAWPWRRRLFEDRATAWTLGCLLAVIMSSTIWSEWWGRTIEQSVMMVLGTAACALIGVSLHTRTWTVLLWAALHSGVALSLFARHRNWPGALDINGDLAGVYFNRNSLGPVAVLGAVTCGVLGIWVLTARVVVASKIIAVTGLITLMAIDAQVATWSGSLSPVIAACIALSVTGLLMLCRDGPMARPRRALAAGFAAAAGVSSAIIVAERVDLFDGRQRLTTLSGRTEIWDVAVDAVGERPVLGWGFMSLWRDDGFLWMLGERAVIVREAHSGYIEVLLGAGFVGLIVLLVFLGRALYRVGIAVLARTHRDAWWLFALLVYVLAVNVTESFIGANLLPWSLLIIALFSAQRPGSGDRPATTAAVRIIQRTSPENDAVLK
jgi:O-antigen ligase